MRNVLVASKEGFHTCLPKSLQLFQLVAVIESNAVSSTTFAQHLGISNTSFHQVRLMTFRFALAGTSLEPIRFSCECRSCGLEGRADSPAGHSILQSVFCCVGCWTVLSLHPVS